MKYKITNLTSGNTIVLNQKEYNRFFDNNDPNNYDWSIIKEADKDRGYYIGVALVLIGMAGLIVINILKIIS